MILAYSGQTNIPFDALGLSLVLNVSSPYLIDIEQSLVAYMPFPNSLIVLVTQS